MTPDGVPRPVRMPRAARREQLLDLAQDLYAEQGFHHVAMDDIADRAQVSKPVLYRHFPGKLELYLAVVDRLGAALLAALERHVAARPDTPAFAEALTRAFLEFVEDAGPAYVLLLESDVTHDPEVRLRVEQAAAEVTRRARDVVVRETGLAPADADLAAAALVGAVGALAVTHFRTAGDADRAVAVGRALVTGTLTALARPTT